MNESSDGSSCNIPKEWFEDGNDELDCKKNPKEENYVINKRRPMFEFGLFEGSTFDSHEVLQSQILHWGKDIGIVDLSAETSRKLKKYSEDSEDMKINFPYEYFVFKCS